MRKSLFAAGLVLLLAACTRPVTEYTRYVVPTMGSGFDGRCLPMAAVPFGMVELGPDNLTTGSGYHYDIDYLFGFCHTHKNGGGCTDFQDIKFMPVPGALYAAAQEDWPEIWSHFSHEEEYAEPGYYRVNLQDYGIQAELGATARCGVHRYTFPEGSQEQVLSIDLKFGSAHSCTIWPEDDYDTVKVARLEVVDSRTVRGLRISNGWCPEQHVYFYARFNKPISEYRLYLDGQAVPGTGDLEGTDVRALLSFDGTDGKPLEAQVGISPVSMDGARKNLYAEAKGKSFDRIRREAHQTWEQELSAFRIADGDSEQKRVFYTCVYYALLYPQLYSDVDGRYRSSDAAVYEAKRPYYAGVLGLWDTFRAQDPLITLLHPEVMSDLMDTFLRHYDHCGQLPIWTLAGQENMCMIGYHAMPVIADAYAKGIRGFDAEALFRAMTASADLDTFGYFLRQFRGVKNYLKYKYIPCDLEITSVSKTLEYCYDDWCIAQMARMLGHEAEEARYLERSGYWRNLFDAETGFMRGKDSTGTWTTPFDPYANIHWRDDYCEGTAWQWTFFVPHDAPGLIEAFGGREAFTDKLDSLFLASSELHGNNVAGDITGMVGQYAHGNEPSHHTIYMYDPAGQPWKAQQRISQVMYELYDTSPEGFCGNDDTGQMSAWFIFSAMGFYPVTHGDGRYFVGTPLFRDLALRHPGGTLRILAPEVSRENCYIQSLSLNGQPLDRCYLTHAELFSGNALLEFRMGPEPNPDLGRETP